MHGRSSINSMTIDPIDSISTMPGRNTSGYHRPGREHFWGRLFKRLRATRASSQPYLKAFPEFNVDFAIFTAMKALVGQKRVVKMVAQNRYLVRSENGGLKPVRSENGGLKQVVKMVA